MSESKPIALLNLKTVVQRTTLGKSTIYRKMANGVFPQKQQISDNRVGWPEPEIDRFISSPLTYTQEQATA